MNPRTPETGASASEARDSTLGNEVGGAARRGPQQGGIPAPFFPARSLGLRSGGPNGLGGGLGL